MNGLERKEFEFVEFNMSEEGHGGFSGYLAVFGVKDRLGEIIEAGAIKNVPSFITDGWSSYNHRGTKLPIATIEEAKQDARGFWVKAEFHSTAEAQDTRTVMRERMERKKSIKGSILFRTLQDEWKDGARVLKSIEVFEGGPVDLPANALATLTTVKSMGDATIDNAEPPKVNGLYAKHLEREFYQRS